MAIKVFIVGALIAQLLFVARFAMSKWQKKELGPLVMLYEGSILLIMVLAVWGNFFYRPPEWVRTAVWCLIFVMFMGKFIVMYTIQGRGPKSARSESRS